MAKRKESGDLPGENVLDYRHSKAKRLNIPPAGLAARGPIVTEKKIRYAYNPHLTPTLRFDATGKADRIQELIEEAGKRKLEPDELAVLKEALRNYEPWLEWAGKREQQWCVADPVALHIHERISTKAILRVAKRQDIQRSLFADPEQEYREAVQFYKHPMDWTNRMILGDSLAVMASLARREALAGKVQMIYMDPPYGIKYASNFQPEVGRRDVKDREEDLTREPEMVKAYRDTWTLGVHSYLSYLRDRLLLYKELLADTGSIFVQIGDENLHRVRAVCDEVFSTANFVSHIVLKKGGTSSADLLSNVADHILFYAKDKARLKYRNLYSEKEVGIGESTGARYDQAEHSLTGERRPLATEEKNNPSCIPSEFRPFKHSNPCSMHDNPKYRERPLVVDGQEFFPPSDRQWSSNPDNMVRVIRAGRLVPTGKNLAYVMYIDDYPAVPINNIWVDVLMRTEKDYVVQTATSVIARCLLMTTDPGDLVLDPTCGSGTTAYVAEEWGRRWITIDVSRVALAIARQRLLTAKYDYYKLQPTSAQDVQRNPDGPWLSDPAGQIQGSCTFDCKTVPHITLKSIAQNQALDPIFDKWAPVLAEKLSALNKALKQSVTKDIRYRLLAKLQDKQKREGKRAVTEADERRWKLPEAEWQEWEVPFDTDPDWPKALQAALTEYRKAWRQKMDEVNACIAARADQEELVDQPFVDRGRVRVSGPFTMEAVIPAEDSIDEEEPQESPFDTLRTSPIGGAPEQLETFGGEEGPVETEPQNAEAYLDRMIRLLRGDGVRFPGNKVMKFTMLEALADGSILHAKGTWGNGDGSAGSPQGGERPSTLRQAQGTASSGQRLVGVMFGPQYGALSAAMVEDGIRIAARRGFDDLVFAAFSFDGAAQAAIQEDPDPKLRIHMAQIRPDVNMGDLLKTTVSSQLFTVSGSPRTQVETQDDGQYVVHMEGVDIYDPVTNSVRPTGAEKVAAWFLDSDYDGRCFCVCQAFFPDKTAWGKLGRALGGSLDDDAFARLSGTVSLPFPAGQHKRVAVKVIDPRGNEVLRVHKLDGAYAV